MKKGILISLFVFSSTMLSGCDDKKESPAQQTQPETSVKATKPTEEKPVITPQRSAEELAEEQAYLQAKKANLYIKATNAFGGGVLDGTSAWPEKEKQTKIGIERKDYRVIKSTLFFSSRVYSSLRNNLQKALDDTSIKFEGLDEESQSLIVMLDKLVPIWEQLEKYNETRKFEDDNGAAGKKLMESFTPAFNEANAQFQKVSQGVDIVSNDVKKKRLERLKKEGKLVELYSEESVELARSILEQFNSTKDFKNKDKVAKANELLAQLEEKLEAQQVEYKKSQSSEKPCSTHYNMLVTHLEHFIGNYRSARKDPGTWAQPMVDNFNRAVGAYNDAR